MTHTQALVLLWELGIQAGAVVVALFAWLVRR